MSERTMFKLLRNMVVFVLLCTGLLVANIYFEVNFPKINRVYLNSEKIPAGSEINILQISDFHNWHPNNGHQELLLNIKRLKPDLIVITGDLIDRKTGNFDNVFYLARELVKINPHTYFVSGNHEWANKNSQLFLSGLKHCGVIVLNNGHEIWSREKMSINICGVDDPSTGRANLDKATRGISTELFTVLLAHAPAIIKEPAVARADLVLCGHTHGGQIRLPFAGAVVAPGQGLFPAYDKGVYQIAPHTTLYIDSGLGTSVLPVRFLNRSQASLIKIAGTSDY